MIDCKDYFIELRQQIFDDSKWDKNKFVVFNHEAGTGKSQSTFRFIGEMTKEKYHRVLYVQRFVRDDELDKTVDTINEYAGKRVAEGVYSKEKPSLVRKKAEAQVLCISHQMYKQICLGNRKELINNRHLLIIDEYPDLVEKISVTLDDIAYIWGRNIGNKFLDNLANLLREKHHNCEAQQERNNDNKMLYVTFNETAFDVYKEKVSTISNSPNNAKETAILSRIHQIMANGCLFYEQAFHTFNNQLTFKLFDGNILLDANSGFDSRYSLSSLFNVRLQEKFYDYTPSLLRHFDVNTGKKELKTQINLAENVFKKISLETKRKVLIVTDKENAETMEDKISNHFHALGYNDEEIGNIIKERIAIDYFGNIIGVNSYRDFDTVVILKTPYFDYLSYALTYFYFRRLDGEEMEDIEVFKNEWVEEIRKNTVAGEVYQAIKRINRDNSQSAEMIICSDYQEAVEIVQQQLPSIRYEKDDSLSINKAKSTMKKDSIFDQRIAEVKRILIEMRETGVKEIKKKEIRDLIMVSNKSNFSKILKELNSFIIENDFIIEGQRIILNK